MIELVRSTNRNREDVPIESEEEAVILEAIARGRQNITREILETAAERQRIAEQFRSEGQGEAARIRGERERELAQIQSEAYRQAEELRGQADAEAARVYADAYDRDADLYAFTKSLETYERTMDASTLFVLGTDSELLRFLEQPD